jgi:hypothetical protein
MKRLYEMPAIELTKFDVEDVITASTGVAGETLVKKETGIDAVAVWQSSWNDAWDANAGI